MALYLDTRGEPTLAIAICDRCHMKMPLARLKPDRDKPGLRVCDGCNDQKDPWRLPFVPKDANISLKNPRRDEDVSNTQCSTVNAAGEVIVGTCPVDTSVRPSST